VAGTGGRGAGGSGLLRVLGFFGAGSIRACVRGRRIAVVHTTSPVGAIWPVGVLQPVGVAGEWFVGVFVQ
jgi:hypothetical protein